MKKPRAITKIVKQAEYPNFTPWYYVSVATELSKPLEHLADRGLIAITAKIGNSSWAMSLLSMGDGTHFIALPVKVRKKEKLSFDMLVEILFESKQKKS